MRQPLNTAGDRFGKLVLLAPVEPDEHGRGKGHARWRCLCDCGTTRIVRQNALRRGNTRSCGCLHRETVGALKRSHGKRQTPEYRIWAHLKARCLTPTDPKYPDYGGRGITVCERWRDDFAAFLADMGPRPSPDHSIERKDNDGPYSPENCVWATRTTQGANKRNNRRYTLNGETHHLTEWARRTGLPYFTLRARMRQGWSVERALTEPLNDRTKFLRRGRH